jgi:hypothetical protein
MCKLVWNEFELDKISELISIEPLTADRQIALNYIYHLKHPEIPICLNGDFEEILRDIFSNKNVALLNIRHDYSSVRQICSWILKNKKSH